MKQRKKQLTLIVMLAFVLMAAVAPTAFAATMSHNDMIISVGEEEFLYVFDVGSSEYTWSSENEDICSVTDMGKSDFGNFADCTARIKGVSKGSTRIRAKTNGSTFVWYISVVAADDDDLSIQFDEKDSTTGRDKVDLQIDEQYTLNWTSQPKKKLDYVSFSSSNQKVATVEFSAKTGKAIVSTHASGRAAITASIRDGGKTDSDTCVVYVATQAQTLMSLDNAKITIGVDEGKQLNVNTPWANDEVTWSSDNESVATVSDSGYVTGKATGITTIKAALKVDSRVYASCRVTVSSSSSEVAYNMEKNGKLNFDRSSFDKFSKDTDDTEINYIQFKELPTAKQGVIYFRYGTDKEKEATLKDTYYRSSNPLISDLTFVPAKDYIGKVNLSFSGRTGGGTGLTGNLTINVKGANNELLLFKANAGASMHIDEAKLDQYCRNTTGAGLDYVRFEEPERGELYFKYGEDEEELVTNAISYYYSGSNKKIEDVVFRPENDDTGTVKIRFTGWDSNWKSFSAVIEVTVEASNNAPDITGEILETGHFEFSASDFEKACKKRKKGGLGTVKFALPDESVGSLCYDYGNSESKLSADTAYGTSGSNLIDKVYFLPASGFTGVAEIKYTGTDKDRVEYEGFVKVEVFEDVDKKDDKEDDNNGDNDPDDDDDKNSEDAPSRDDATQHVGSFVDVDTSDYFAGPVLWAVENGITTGTTESTFSPDDKCTTAQILTFLWRAVGSPEPVEDNPFSDVPDDPDEKIFYVKPAIWASEKGMVNGTLFRPNEPCTRSETVKYLWILAGKPEAPASQFKDVSATADYCQAVAWAVEQGVTTGTSSETFTPSGTCTRAQIVTFLWRDLANQSQG